MNTLRKQILIGLTVLGMGTATIAAHADEGGWHHGGDQHGHMMGKRMAHFRAHLHDKLKLSAAQETAWTAYVAATTPPKPAAGARPEHPQHPDFASMTAPQKMQMFDDMAKKRLAMQESHLSATKTFYATLTPEQQKTFDHAINMAMRHGHRHHHEGREHDHRGGDRHDGDHHGWN